jgi:hypothetical protein
MKKVLFVGSILLLNIINANAMDWDERIDIAYRNYINISPANYIWDNSGRNTFLLGAELGSHFSPVPLTHVGLEFNFGGLDVFKGDDFSRFYLGCNIPVGIVFPIAKNNPESARKSYHFSFFADAVFQFSIYQDKDLQYKNYFDTIGLFTEDITIGFDAGIFFWWNYAKFMGLYDFPTGFEIKYQCLIYQGYYTNKINISWILFGGGKLKTKSWEKIKNEQ